ncbi:unnamed protein product [Durusdinium trenchii]|uniref:Uncharacterized protein n=1 Tax=Durusdinium trenchii TaxID=1381693 RepID=A0ABP0P4R8_9DINO
MSGHSEEGTASSHRDEVCAAHRREVVKARKAVALFLWKNRFDPGDPNSPRGFFVTYPLHEAAKQNNAYIASKLLMFGARLEQKDFWGHTADSYAGKHSHHEIMKVLQHHAKYCLSPYDFCHAPVKWQACPPPRGFEEFFAHLEVDPLVQVRSESQWLLLRGCHRVRNVHRLNFGKDRVPATTSAQETKLRL